MKKLLVAIMLALLLFVGVNIVKGEEQTVNPADADVVLKLDLCNCITESKVYFPDKTDEEVQEMCKYAFVDLINKVSVDCACLVVGVIDYTEECEE